MFNDREKVETVLRHMRRVENNCVTIAMNLIDTEPRFARELIRRGREHDLSKLGDYEFEHLWSWDTLFKGALLAHRRVNRHHLEHYTLTDCEYPIQDIDIAEMVADCKARSEEFGTDIKEWFERPEYSPFKDRIDYYLGLLLLRKFEYPKLD